MMREPIKKRFIRIVNHRLVKILAGVVLFYLLFAYFAVNPLAKKIIPWVAETKLASKASVEKVTFDPLRLKVTINRFELAKNNGAPLASFKQLMVDFEMAGMFKRAWQFKAITLDAPLITVAFAKDGRFNWREVIDQLNKNESPPSDTIPRLIVGNIMVNRGNIAYSDARRSTPAQLALTPLSFQLAGFSTLPQDRGNYLISAQLANQGGRLKWSGNIGVNPIASKGVLAFEHVRLQPLLRLANNAQWPFSVTDGDIEAHFYYDFSLPQDKPKLVLSQVFLNAHNVTGLLKSAQPISMGQASISVPQLNFLLQDQPQLQFQDLQLKLQNISLKQAAEPILTIPEIAVNQVALDLAKAQVDIGQVKLAQGSIIAKKNAAGVLNWQSLLADKSAPTVTASAPADAVTVDAKPVAWGLNVHDIQLEHWRLAAEDQSFAHPLQLQVADINTGLRLNLQQGGLALSQLQVQLADIRLVSSLQAAPVATIGALNLSDAQIDLATQNVQAQSVVVSGLNTSVVKAQNQSINWQTILAPLRQADNRDPAPPATTQAPAWQVSVKKIALEDAHVHVEDRSTTSVGLALPVIIDIEKANVALANASLDLSRPVPINAGFTVKQGGRFTSTGNVTLSPFKAEMAVNLANMALAPFSPYLNQQTLFRLADGAANVSGKLSVQNQAALALRFRGKFGVNQLSIVEEKTAVPFLSWAQLASDNLEVSLAPNRLHMADLHILKPQGEFIINEDKTLNINKFLRQPPAAPAKVAAVKSPAAQPASNPASHDLIKPAASPASPAVKPDATTTPVASRPPSFPVGIDTVNIEAGKLAFEDRSLQLKFGALIHSLTGVINGVSNSPDAVAQVELDGKVDEYGAVRIRGELQPLDATNFTDLKLMFSNLEMNRLTPYSGQFAGRRIDAGKLSVDLEYKIKQRQLLGTNKFVIHKIKLGEKIASKDALDLPLDLAIAILEDSDGVIDLDLPIAGSLDDPQFSYGSIVWKAIKNVLTKIVTAPFRALGKLFGGNAEKPDAILFDAGTATLNPPELEKLHNLSTGLAKRPGLAIAIIPSFNEALDTRAIQTRTLRRQVAEKIGQKQDKNQAPGPINLTDEKTQKALDDLYDTLTHKSLLKKITTAFKKPEAGHFEAVLEKLTQSIVVSQADLQALAKARGAAIAEQLVSQGVLADKVRLQSAQTVAADAHAAQVPTTLKLDTK